MLCHLRKYFHAISLCYIVFSCHHRRLRFRFFRLCIHFLPLFIDIFHKIPNNTHHIIIFRLSPHQSSYAYHFPNIISFGQLLPKSMNFYWIVWRLQENVKRKRRFSYSFHVQFGWKFYWFFLSYRFHIIHILIQ